MTKCVVKATKLKVVVKHMISDNSSSCYEWHGYLLTSCLLSDARSPLYRATLPKACCW